MTLRILRTKANFDFSIFGQSGTHLYWSRVAVQTTCMFELYLNDLSADIPGHSQDHLTPNDEPTHGVLLTLNGSLWNTTRNTGWFWETTDTWEWICWTLGNKLVMFLQFLTVYQILKLCIRPPVFPVRSVTLYIPYLTSIPKECKHQSANLLLVLLAITQDPEALRSFTDPHKSSAAHASLLRSLQSGFLFPLPNLTPAQSWVRVKLAILGSVETGCLWSAKFWWGIASDAASLDHNLFLMGVRVWEVQLHSSTRKSIDLLFVYFQTKTARLVPTYRWVSLNPNKQYQVKIFRVWQI